MNGTPVDRIPISLRGETPPMIDGNRVVWAAWEEEAETRRGVIAMYDIASRSRIQISNAMDHGMHPSVSGDIIVWEDNRNGNTDIYILNLRTNE